MNPVFQYTRVLLKNKVSSKYYLRAALYMLKFIIFEPFRWLEILFYGRDIDRQEVKAPIFILGYYRSGTTHLQELLLQDKQFAYLNFFQCIFPSAFLVTEKALKPIFDLVLKLTNFHHPAHRIPLNLSMPAEEDVCLVGSGYEHAPNWGQVFPDRFHEYFYESVFFERSLIFKESFKYQLKSLMKRLSLKYQGKRLLMKSPPQTARLQTLIESYPDAKFVFIHRSPYEVFKSNQRLWKSFKDQQLHDQPSQEIVDQNILWSLDQCLEHFERSSTKLNENQLIQVSFDELMDSPTSVIQSIYSQLNLGDFEKSKPQIEAYIQAHHKTNNASHSYQLEDCLKVEEHCQKWIEKWNYKRPSTTPAKTT